MTRLVYLGQKPIGERGFELVRDHVVAVVSNARPAGWWQSARLVETGLPFLDDQRADDDAVLELIRTSQADALLSVQHSRILGPAVLEAVSRRAWNVHLAPLPNYRGFNGPSHAILDRAETYGATVHWIDQGIDTGPIAYQTIFPIEGSETALSLYEKAERSALQLLALLAGDLGDPSSIPRVASHDRGASIYHGRKDLDGERQIRSLEEAGRKARAFHFPPFPPAYILEGGRRYIVTPVDV